MSVNVNDIEHLDIKLISGEDVKQKLAPNGEISSADIYQRKNNEAVIKYDSDGLFAEERFGSETKKEKNDSCGFIDLAVPVAHIWYFKGQKKILSTITGIKQGDLEDILYYKKYLKFPFTEDDDDDSEDDENIEKFLSIEGYLEKSVENPDIDAEIGGAAILRILNEINLNVKIVKLIGKLKELKDRTKRKTLTGKLKLFNQILQSGNKLENLMLTVLPVIPLSMRRLSRQLDGSIEIDPINHMYERIILINNRINKLKEDNAPLPLLFVEQRALQEAVDYLLDFGRRDKSLRVISKDERNQSLTSRMVSKTGHFRKNVLAKRVNFSGRAVITVGPELRIDQCGLPRRIACELFGPLVYSALKEKRLIYYHSSGLLLDDKYIYDLLKGPKKPVDIAEQWLYDKAMAELENIMSTKVVLLNRYPSLHRHSIMAFQPVLNEEGCDAIKINPLVCSPFNADFDGDTMTVHLSISAETQEEAKKIMSVGNSILSSSDSSLLMAPSQDAVLGAYYYTYINEKNKVNSNAGDCQYKDIPKYYNLTEAFNAYEYGKIELQEPILVYITNKILAPCEKVEGKSWILTSAGNLIFYDELLDLLRFSTFPEKNELGLKRCKLIPIEKRNIKILFFDIQGNECEKEINFVLDTRLDKKSLKKFIFKVYNEYGAEYTLEFLDRLKTIGHKAACDSGLSISAFDVAIPVAKKNEIIAKVEEEIEEQRDKITRSDKIERWKNAANELFDFVKNNAEPMNPLHRMIASGSRGDDDNYKQVIAMRGIMKDTSGEEQEEPILSNFTEGLQSTEYFISASGARLGLIDTALHTAEPGYFARILSYATHDLIINNEDCCVTELDLTKLKEKLAAMLELPQENVKVQEALKAYLVNELDTDVKITYSIPGKGPEYVLAKNNLDELLAQNIVTKLKAEAKIPLMTISDIKMLINDNTNDEDDILVKKEDRVIGREDVRRDKDLIKARSPISCLCRNGICRRCYGRDFATLKPVRLGTAIGLIASQTMSEKATQMNLKAFHSGGVSSSKVAIADGISGIKKLFNATASGSVINFNEELLIAQVADKMQFITDLILQHILCAYNQSGISDINSKLVEVVIRKMIGKVVVTDPGDSQYVIGDEVDKAIIFEENKYLKCLGKKQIGFRLIVKGIDRIARENGSFLAAAGYGYLREALSLAALSSKQDGLTGIIENTIIGKLIPAGDNM